MKARSPRIWMPVPCKGLLVHDTDEGLFGLLTLTLTIRSSMCVANNWPLCMAAERRVVLISARRAS